MDASELCDPSYNPEGFRIFLHNTAIGRADVDRFLLAPDKPSYIILGPYPPGYPQVGWYTTSEFKCADCRLQGGTNVKPAYLK